MKNLMKIKTGIIITILFISCYTNANSQNLDTTRLNSIDLKLEKFRSQQVSGIWLQIAGAGLIAIGTSIEKTKDSKANRQALIFSGGGCMLTGGIIRLSSLSNFKLKNKNK